MKIYIAKNLFKKPAFWYLNNRNSCLVSGLSGGGKSYLMQQMINQFEELGFHITVLSDKVYVDYKSSELTRIDSLSEPERLLEFIEDLSEKFKDLKNQVEKSGFSHISELNHNQKILIVIDEVWSLEKLEKEIKKKFFDLIELVYRQGRYLNIYILVGTQISRVSESSMPLRQSSIIISGKTDTSELSHSLFSSDIAYTAPMRVGQFIFWDRLSKPMLVKVVPLKKSIFQKIKEFLWK